MTRKAPAPHPVPAANPQPQLISARWLVLSISLVLAAAAVCAWAALCLLFWQGSWQLLYHPSAGISRTPEAAGLDFESVAFAPDNSGQPQLTAWWIPQGPASPRTAIYLHGADGNLSNTVELLVRLHSAGLNIFAIDYRGFGKSAEIRPTEQTANADAVTAWAYLRNHQHLQIRNIVVYGQGAGAAFAANLAMQRPVPALILTQISPTAHAIFRQDPRARLLPLFLLANQHLNPAPDLNRLHIPKLFLDWPGKSSSTEAITQQNYQLASPPKHLVSLPGPAPSAQLAALRAFLAQVLPPAH